MALPNDKFGPAKNSGFTNKPTPPGGKPVFTNKPTPVGGKPKPATMKPKPISIDDRIYRTMPITEKQLGQIKKHYGIK